jgi:hypothetical protein
VQAAARRNAAASFGGGGGGGVAGGGGGGGGGFGGGGGGGVSAMHSALRTSLASLSMDDEDWRFAAADVSYQHSFALCKVQKTTI